jgi:PncC family amidohydrolase
LRVPVIAFKGGIVAYSNDAKINLLGVPKNVIETNGAVSKETALEMARGARKIFGADIGVSVTGVCRAGQPGGQGCRDYLRRAGLGRRRSLQKN